MATHAPFELYRRSENSRSEELNAIKLSLEDWLRNLRTRIDITHHKKIFHPE